MKIIRIPFIVPIILMCLLGFISPTWADSDANKTYVQLLNEVFQTELVYPQGKGEVQIFLEGAYAKAMRVKAITFRWSLNTALPIPGSWAWIGLCFNNIIRKTAKPEAGLETWR